MTDLYAMRHAKSAYPIGVADHDRPLNERGRLNALVAAAWLAERSIDTVLVSSAVRTRQTWDIIATQVHARCHVLPELYEASAATIEQAVTEMSAGVTLLIAHNPGIAEYVLTHGASDPALIAQVRAKFPTSAIAHLHDQQLVEVVIPR